MKVNHVFGFTASSGEKKQPLTRQEWLRRLGVFGDRDPFPRSFTELQAEREKEEDRKYESYLVEPSVLAELPERGSGVLFARRGDGKTASRLAFAQHHQDAFLVEYTDFFPLIPHLASLTLGHHIYEICKIALFTLARRMGVAEVTLTRYRLDREDWVFLVDELFKQREISASLTWIGQIFTETPDERNAWKAQLGEHDGNFVELARCLFEIDQKTHKKTYTPHKEDYFPNELSPNLFQDFFQAINGIAGCPCTYVLVDRIDAFAETKGLNNCEKLLKHLFDAEGVHESSRVHFRFFLPLELKARLLRYSGQRIAVRDLKWTDDALLGLVRERLAAASDDAIKDLEALTWMPFGKRKIQLVRQLLAASDHSPRSLLALCHELFDAHAAHQAESAGKEKPEGTEDLLSEQDFQAALRKFAIMKKLQQPPPEPDRFRQISKPVFVIIALLFSTALILAAVFYVVQDLRLAIPLSIVLILLMVLFLSWVALAMGWISAKDWQNTLNAVLRRLSLPGLGGQQNRDKGPP